MAGLEEEVSLDISDALRDADQLAQSAGAALEDRLTEAVGAFASSLSSAVDDFASQFSTAADAIQDSLVEAITTEQVVPVTAATDQIPDEVSSAVAEADTKVDVSADASAVSDAIDAAVASADTEVQLSVDQTDVDEALDQISESSAEASEGLGSVASGSQAVSAAASLAGGSVESFAAGASKLGLGAAGATALLAGFTASAIGSLGATERLESSMGDLSDRIETLQVGDLTIDLSDLAVTIGSSGSKMRTAAVDAFDLGQSFGATREESAGFAASIIALSARASVLRPSLGDAGEAAITLVRALASGRDRGLLPFNLGLTSTEINARATARALADGREAVTGADRAFAGAALAVEKLGTNLQRDIAEGSRNPIIQARSLSSEFRSLTTEIGKPLVAPVLQTVRQAEPAVRSFGASLGDIAQAALPGIEAGLRAAVPLLDLAGTVIQGVTDSLEFLGITATAAGAGIGFLVGGPVGALVGGLAGLASDLGVFGDAEEEATDNAYELAQAIRAAGSAIRSSDVWKERARDIERAAAAERVAQVNARESVARAQWLGKAFDDTSFAAERETASRRRANDSLAEFTRLAKEDIGAATLVVDGLRQRGESVDRLQRVLNLQAVAQRNANATDRQATDITTQLTGTYEEQIDVLNERTDALLASYDVTFRAIHADEQARDAVDNLNTSYDEAIKAGKSQAEAQEAQNRALVSAEEDLLHAAAAAGAKAEDDHKAEGAAAAHSAAVNTQIGYLQRFADKLSPDSPLRQFLQEYIDKLRNEIPPVVETTVTIQGVDVALSQFAALQQAAFDALNTSGIVSAPELYAPPAHSAAGGTFGSDGRTFVGEEGVEYVEGLPGGGFRVYSNPQVRAGAAAGSGIGAQTVDNSVHAPIQVIESPGNAEATASATVRRLRHLQWAGG